MVTALGHECESLSTITGCSVKRITAAQETVEFLQRTTRLSEEVAERTSRALQAVTRSEKLPTDKCEPSTPIRDFPPLFSEMRELIFGLELNLKSVMATLDRLEI